MPSKLYQKLYILAHHKEPTVSYSQMLRKLRNGDKDKLIIFQKTFKSAFDQAVVSGEKDPEQPALIKALESIDIEDDIEDDKADVDDAVNKERSDFMLGQYAPELDPQQSFGLYLDNNVESHTTSYASSSEDRKRMIIKLLELLNEQDDKDEKDNEEPSGVPSSKVPQIGTYDNCSGVRGAGPTETGGFLQL